MKPIYDGSIIEHNGRKYRVNIEHDTDSGAPWEESDGHGPVRECRTPHWHREGAKQPGERPMNRPGRNEWQYFYDWQAAVKLARSEGWGLGADDMAELANRIGRAPTKGEVIAESVRRDFESLAGWANDEWHYVGVIVTDITDDEDAETDYAYALWGVESISDEYIAEVAQELAKNSNRDTCRTI